MPRAAKPAVVLSWAGGRASGQRIVAGGEPSSVVVERAEAIGIVVDRREEGRPGRKPPATPVLLERVPHCVATKTKLASADGDPVVPRLAPATSERPASAQLMRLGTPGLIEDAKAFAPPLPIGEAAPEQLPWGDLGSPGELGER